MTTRNLKLVEVATRRRVAISMGAVTLVLFGLIALQDLKVNLLPDLSYARGLGPPRRSPRWRAVAGQRGTAVGRRLYAPLRHC